MKFKSKKCMVLHMDMKRFYYSAVVFTGLFLGTNVLVQAQQVVGWRGHSYDIGTERTDKVSGPEQRSCRAGPVSGKK
jgi:hypothetical protein